MGLCLTGALTSLRFRCGSTLLTLQQKTFWQTEKDAWYALNTCYATLDGVDIWDELCTDNAHSHKTLGRKLRNGPAKNGISTANG
ncbi:hypothetical protein NXW91_23750 [Bacteroides fragilis]|nr:hypothetical protein [Bacteroides fragilis]